MRGSISLDEAFMLTYEDRQLISKLIEENIKTTEKTGMPFF